MDGGREASEDQRTRAFNALSFEEEKHAVLARVHLAEAARCRRDQTKYFSKQFWEAYQILQGHLQELHKQLSTKASAELLADREVMLAAVSVDGTLLEHGSPELRGDVEVASAAVRENARAWRYLGDRILQDRDAMLKVVRENSLALGWASPEQRDDKEFMLAALTNESWVLDFASDRLGDDAEVVKAALQAEFLSDRNRGSVLSIAGEAVRADKAILLQAVASRAWALQAASEVLKADREVVLAALRSQIRADLDQFQANVLEQASEEFRADSELVLEAVRVQGAAVELAHPTLRQNKDFVLQAARRAPIGEGSECYRKADALVHQSVSLDKFRGASKCKLAIPGDSCPVLTVALETSPPSSSTSIPKDVISCRASLLSGAIFTCSLQVPADLDSLPTISQPAPGPSPGSPTSSSGPAQKRARLSMSVEEACHPEQAPAAMTVADLADVLVEELPKQTQVHPPPSRVFILFSKDSDPENPVSVTPWDWNRPIVEFI